MKATGGCLCGAVRYEIDGEALFMGFCHCRDCQKATGAGHAPGMSFRRRSVRISGETRTFAVIGSSGRPMPRHFCPACGSSLFGRSGDYFSFYLSARRALAKVVTISRSTAQTPSCAVSTIRR